jgi:hypothetical protein
MGTCLAILTGVIIAGALALVCGRVLFAASWRAARHLGITHRHRGPGDIRIPDLRDHDGLY